LILTGDFEGCGQPDACCAPVRDLHSSAGALTMMRANIGFAVGGWRSLLGYPSAPAGRLDGRADARDVPDDHGICSLHDHALPTRHFTYRERAGQAACDARAVFQTPKPDLRLRGVCDCMSDGCLRATGVAAGFAGHHPAADLAGAKRVSRARGNVRGTPTASTARIPGSEANPG
jgi:hypothetical protein